MVFGFPDTIWEPVDGFQHLVAELGEVALGLFRCRDLTQSDVVTVDRARVTGCTSSRDPAVESRLGLPGCEGIRAGGLAGHAEPRRLSRRARS